jgi:hypothetical protein
MLTYFALIVGLVALFMAWISNRRSKDLKERLAQANSRVYNLRRDIDEKLQQAEQERMTMKFQLLKLQGNLSVTPEMKVGEVLATHPAAGQVLAGFHIGGCSSCSVDNNQSLAEAVAVNGREIEPILAALNTLVAENGNGHGAPEQLKTPNIQLHI